MPIPIAAAIAGGVALAGLAGSAINASSQASTNRANASMDEATRNWQSQENQINRKWQEEQWQKQFDATNQYNTPSAQMERYRQAGLNPYLHINGQVGSGQSTGTSVTPPAMAGTPQHSQMVAPRYDVVGPIANALGSYNSVRGTDANVANQQAQADYQKALTAKEIASVAGYNKAREYLNSSLGVSGISSPAERIAEGEITQLELSNEMRKIQNTIAKKYGDDQASAILANTQQQYVNMVAQVGKMASDVKLNDATIGRVHAESRELASRFVRNLADAYKLRKEGDHYLADTTTINAIRSSVTAMYRSNATTAELNAGMSGMSYLDSSAHFTAGSMARDWLSTPQAAENYRDIMKINYDDVIHAVSTSIHAISPMVEAPHATVK